MLDELRAAPAEQAQRIERDIRRIWSRTGSATMDLLLKRGRDALEVNDSAKAMQHFTALTDHAPDFAEGWHGLALAYYQAQRYGPTVDALERTLALNPQHFGAMKGLGAVLEQVGMPDRAYDAYSLVLDINPNDTDVIEALERLETRVKGTTL